MTTYDGLAPSAFADLVEYCYGGANTTWGATRISDGHPQPYEIRYFEVSCKDFDGACFPWLLYVSGTFEPGHGLDADGCWCGQLGNEQYNAQFPQQVAAMEAKAKQLGRGGQLYYMNPNNVQQ